MGRLAESGESVWQLSLVPWYQPPAVGCLHQIQGIFNNHLPVGVSRGYTDYHQGRAIHMADSRID